MNIKESISDTRKGFEKRRNVIYFRSMGTNPMVMRR